MPSVNTPIARGMFCGAKYTHHTFTPIIKHLITKANKHPGKKSFIDLKKHEKIPLCIIHKIKLPLPEDPPLKSKCPSKRNYKNYLKKKKKKIFLFLSTTNLLINPPAYSPGHYHPDPSKILRTKNIPAWTHLTVSRFGLAVRR